MCYSKNISLSAYISGTILCALVYQIPNPFYKVIGLFFLFVTQMQLIDFFLWDNQQCNSEHRLTSKAGMWLNFMQPIVMCLLVLYYSKRLSSNTRKFIYVCMAIYMVMFLKYAAQYKPSLQCIHPTKEINHLVWNWTQLPYKETFITIYLLFIFLAVLLGFPAQTSLFISVVLLSFFFTYLLTPNIGVGSAWCIHIILVPAFYLLKHHISSR